MVYFRWRSGLIGAEQMHAGILPHDGRPGRTYEEIRALGQELRQLAPDLEGTTPRADVAFILSYDSLWALENQPHHADLDNPYQHFTSAYEHLSACRISVDFVPPKSDLSYYKLVIAPALHVVSPKVART